MGATFENLTCEELCDLMCGKPEDDGEDEDMKLNMGDEVTIKGRVIEGGGGDIPHLIELSSGISIWIHDTDIQTIHPNKEGEEGE